MLRHLEKVKRVPTKTHLVAVSVCVAIFGTALLLPSEDVAANRTQLSIELKAPGAELKATGFELKASGFELKAAKIVPKVSGVRSNATEAGTTAYVPATDVTTSVPQPQQDTIAVSTPVEPPEQWLKVKVKSGDNLTTLFSKAGLGANQMYPMLNGIKPSKALNQLKPGEEVAFLIDQDELIKFRHTTSPLTQTLISRTDDTYSVEAIQFTPEITHNFRHGSINDSLFLSGKKAGLSQQKIMELAGIFGWDIDFILDIRQGDSFSVIYEERWLDGKNIGEGKIVAAEFTNQGKTFQALRYTNSKGDSNYFTPEGKSMRKAFLRTPVDFSRISSRFNPNRKHPIFKTRRPHRAVDYAAPTGTPIKTSGDGKVTFAGRKNGYGKVVIVQHGQNYTTLYAHMSRIKPGMKRGKRIKQGQTIGYVGSTGYATGPHLHYEFRINGVHRNPLTVSLPQAAALPKSELKRFKPLANDLLIQLSTYRQTQLAQN